MIQATHCAQSGKIPCETHLRLAKTRRHQGESVHSCQASGSDGQSSGHEHSPQLHEPHPSPLHSQLVKHSRALSASSALWHSSSASCSATIASTCSHEQPKHSFSRHQVHPEPPLPQHCRGGWASISSISSSVSACSCFSWTAETLLSTRSVERTLNIFRIWRFILNYAEHRLFKSNWGRFSSKVVTHWQLNQFWKPKSRI